MLHFMGPTRLREAPLLYFSPRCWCRAGRVIVLLSTGAELALASGMLEVDRDSILDRSVEPHRSVCRSVVLDISANVVREAFDEDAREFIIVEDVIALQRTLGQLVSVLLDVGTVL